jgi:outer membrane protein with beta-barrel domain
MLTLSRTGFPITCPLVQREQAEAWLWVQRLTRSLKVTAASLPLTLLTLLATPCIVPAQEPPPGLVEVRDGGNRHGFWVGLGLGAGGESFDLRDGAGYSNAFYKPTISFKAGGTLGQNWRLGGEVLSWIHERAHAVESLSSILFVAQFYPIRAAGLYLKGGLGVGRNAVDFDDGFNVGDTGFAGLVGAGYELRLGRRFYLNPVVDLVGHRYDARAGGSYRERLVNFGLGIMVQTGR